MDGGEADGPGRDGSTRRVSGVGPAPPLGGADAVGAGQLCDPAGSGASCLPGRCAARAGPRGPRPRGGLFKQEELYLVIYGGLLGFVMGAVQLGLLLLSGRL